MDYSYNAAASQATLINPKENTKLVVTEKSAINNKIYLNGRPRFVISTTDMSNSKTLITDVNTKEIVVKINRRNFFSDEITFVNHNEGKPVKAGKEWFVERKLPDGMRGWTISTREGRFVWKLDPKTRWALAPEADLDHPVAWLQLPEGNKPYAIVISPGLEHFWDIIVGGWSYLEQEMRFDERMVGGGSWV